MFDTINETVSAPQPAEDGAVASPQSYGEVRALFNQAMEQRMVELHEDPSLNLEHAGIRFSDLVNERRLADMTIVLIGVGGIGNHVFRTLLYLGCKNIILYDDDIVDIENVRPQAHELADLGISKVQAAADYALRHSGLRITTHQKRVESYADILADNDGNPPDMVVMAPDAMPVRLQFLKDFFDSDGFSLTAISKFPKWYLDLRMSAGHGNVFALPVQSMCIEYREFIARRDFHEKTHFGGMIKDEMIFEDEEGVQEPCTARATAFTGMTIASYFGAFMAWMSKLQEDSFSTDDFFDMSTTASEFHWMESFDALNWNRATKTPQIYALVNHINTLNNQLMRLQTTQAHYEKLYSSGYKRKTIWECTPKLGDVVITEDGAWGTILGFVQGLGDTRAPHTARIVPQLSDSARYAVLEVDGELLPPDKFLFMNSEYEFFTPENLSKEEYTRRMRIADAAVNGGYIHPLRNKELMGGWNMNAMDELNDMLCECSTRQMVYKWDTPKITYDTYADFKAYLDVNILEGYHIEDFHIVTAYSHDEVDANGLSGDHVIPLSHIIAPQPEEDATQEVTEPELALPDHTALEWLDVFANRRVLTPEDIARAVLEHIDEDPENYRSVPSRYVRDLAYFLLEESGKYIMGYNMEKQSPGNINGRRRTVGGKFRLNNEVYTYVGFMHNRAAVTVEGSDDVYEVPYAMLVSATHEPTSGRAVDIEVEEPHDDDDDDDGYEMDPEF